jgi:hypothetical protein
MRSHRSLLAVSALLLFPVHGYSQSIDAELSADSFNGSRIPDSPHPRYRELSLYTAQSFGHPQVISSLENQRLFFVEVRDTGHLVSDRHFDLNGNAALQPLVLHSSDLAGGRSYTYGAGGSVGLQFVPHTTWPWQPFFDVDGGTVAFLKDTPVSDSRRVNITLEFGPGLYIPIDEHHALKTGAWFFHFSNARTAPRNPGFDGFLFYIAYSFRTYTPHYSRDH